MKPCDILSSVLVDKTRKSPVKIACYRNELGARRGVNPTSSAALITEVGNGSGRDKSIRPRLAMRRGAGFQHMSRAHSVIRPQQGAHLERNTCSSHQHSLLEIVSVILSTSDTCLTRLGTTSCHRTISDFLQIKSFQRSILVGSIHGNAPYQH